MRIVLDTNIPVSAALKRNSMPRLAAHIVEQCASLPKSTVTEQQLFEVVARPYFAPLIDAETHTWLKSLMGGVELVTITERIAACRAPRRKASGAGD